MSTDFLQKLTELSPKRLALLALELKERLDASEARSREPVAIIGLGCRFPGAASPGAFAELLAHGVDAISEVPRDRWDIDAYFDPDPDAPGRMNTRFGGFVDGIDQFDPAHFGISPREAAGMDPQQRLLLEVAWEALEHAGIAPDALSGTQTGVFLGIATLDYASLMMQVDSAALDLYSSSGGSHAVAAGRLSYILGLHGPAVAIDTACSSSLVATHLALQSLRNGECDTALVGGVNIICAPETTLMLSRARMMAPDGRCKTFDARADGFVRGEGCGVLVLKRLSAAQADGNRILAIVRGSAVNQDGRSSGLTAPNGPSQEAVIRAALANAGVTASDVSYVEAHGTGTSLGDPIELRALGAVYGAGRTQRDALVASSVKTNVGHLEAAAGVAGLAKVILALQHERIPAHLHAPSPTPHVDWGTLGVRLPRDGGEAWDRSARPRLAGISSFGFSGTNAHVIIEEAPDAAHSASPLEPRAAYMLPIAARTSNAARELAGRYADVLARSGAPAWPDMCDAAATGRAQLVGARAAIVAPDAATARELLERLAQGVGPLTSETIGTASCVAADAVSSDVADVAFVFTGQGGADIGMGRTLYDSAPVFRAAMMRLDAVLRDIIGVSLVDVLYGPSAHEFARADVSATAHVAFQVALAELWRSWGVEPASVAGHSLGEYAAAVVAGMMSEQDALRLVAARGRLVGALPHGAGAMAIVDASQSQIERVLGVPIGAPAALEIAAINAPEQVVLTGPTRDIERAEQALAAQGVRVRRLGLVAHAYHSAQLDPMLEEYCARCDAPVYAAPQVEWVSCLTGDVQSSASVITAQYWIDQMRQPVDWRRTVHTLAARGARVLIEIGPTAVLSGLSRASLLDDGVTDAVSVPSMRAGIDPWITLTDALARGWVRGMRVRWTQCVQGDGARPVLPTYPFQRQRYWLPTTASRGRSRLPLHDGARGVLGEPLPGPIASFAIPIGPDAPAPLREHIVRGRPLFAGSAFVDAALLAAPRVLGQPSVMLHDVQFLAPLETGGDDIEACLTVEHRDDGGTTVTLFSHARGDDTTAWTRHMRARASVAAVTPRSASIATLQQSLGEALDSTTVYEAFARRDITIGPSVRAVQELWRADGAALSRLTVPPGVGAADRRASLLDGALQTLGVAAPNFHDHSRSAQVRVLARIGHAQVHGDLADAAWCHATISDSTDSATWTGAVHVYDAAGVELAAFEDLSLVIAAATVAEAHDALTYDLTWRPAPFATATGAPRIDALATLVSERLDVLGALSGFAQYDELIPVLEATATAFAAQAMQALGFGAQSRALSAAELSTIAPQHHRLVQRLMVSVSPADVRAMPDEATRARVRMLGGGEMAMLERCGAHLADVLRGRHDAMQLLFPDGSFAALDALYRDSPFARTYNGAVRDAVQAEVAARGTQSLRILEIGAGTGGTTAYALDVAPTGSQYTFTDLSPLFLERARERFGAHAGFDTRLLDIEQEPLSQGFAPSSFDVIIASNVLHATADVRAALAHVRQLAAPGALVVLIEGTAPLRWVDITFGLTEGWWRFTDHDIRPSHPLVGSAPWVSLLHGAGFEGAAASPRAPAQGSASATQSVIIARAPAPARTASPPTLVFGDSGGVAQAFAQALEEQHVTVRRVAREEATPANAPHDIAAFCARHPGPVSIVYLSALDIAPGVANADAAREIVLLTETLPLAILRAVADAGVDVRVSFVTCGAQRIGDVHAVTSPEQASLWGWMRGYALEHPRNAGAVIDLDATMSAQASADMLLDQLSDVSGEDQVAFRDGARLVARLTPRAALPVARCALREDGAYLVTGGTGGLGLRIAEWLAECGAREIVLLSRSGVDADPADARHATLAAISARGATVRVVRADASDEGQLREIVARFGAEWAPLRGVVHAAVQMTSAPLAQLSPSALDSMRAGKVAAARALDRLTRHLPIDFLVLFSSTTSLLGVHGLAHYAAANQYLDALASYRRARGLAALSVAWGTWDVMRVASDEAQAAIVRGGMRQLSSATALDLLGRLLAAGDVVAAVADVDWRTLVPVYEARRTRPLIRELASRHAARPEKRPDTPRGSASLSRAIAAVRAARPDARLPLLQQLVRREVATVLGYANDDGIPLDFGFFELGLDSLMSVELKRRLEVAVEQPLPSTLTFNYPNVGALAGFLVAELFASDNAATPQAPPTPPQRSTPPATPAVADDALSDDEVEARLLARLDALR